MTTGRTLLAAFLVSAALWYGSIRLMLWAWANA